MGRLSINLVVLAVVLFLDGEDFLVCEKDVFCARSWHAAGGDALLLSVGYPSKWQ